MNKEHEKSELEDHIMKVAGLSFELESYFAEKNIFLASEFIDNISSMIIYEQKQKR